MRPFSPLLSYLISRKKAELPAYGPDGKTSGSGAHDASGAFLRGYGPRVRESHGIVLCLFVEEVFVGLICVKVTVCYVVEHLVAPFRETMKHIPGADVGRAETH